MLHLRLTERDVERVLAGHQPPGRTDLAEVAGFVAQIRTMSAAEQTPPMSPLLLAELDVADMRRRADGPSHRRRRMQVARRRWRMVGAAAVVVLLGGLAVAGLRDTGRGTQTEIGDTGGTTSKATPSSSAPPADAPPSSEAPATTATTVAPAPEPSSAPPATTGGELEPEPPPDADRHGDGQSGPPDEHQPDNPFEECFEHGQLDYDCWVEVYEQTQGTQSAPPP